MARYREEDLAQVIMDLWERLGPRLGELETKELLDKYPVIDEIDQFGPTGPVGLGLGIFGGHAIGED